MFNADAGKDAGEGTRGKRKASSEFFQIINLAETDLIQQILNKLQHFVLLQLLTAGYSGQPQWEGLCRSYLVHCSQP